MVFFSICWADEGSSLFAGSKQGEMCLRGYDWGDIFGFFGIEETIDIKRVAELHEYGKVQFLFVDFRFHRSTYFK